MNEEHGSVTSRRYKENWDDAVQLLNKQDELISKLRKGLDAADALMRESHGVAGLHLNGDLATWDELRTGGRFEEWLIDFDAALTPNAQAHGWTAAGLSAYAQSLEKRLREIEEERNAVVLKLADTEAKLQEFTNAACVILDRLNAASRKDKA